VYKKVVKKKYSEEECKLLALASITCIFVSMEMPINMFFANELLGFLFTIVNGIIVGFLIYYLIKVNKKLKLYNKSNSIQVNNIS